MPEQIDTAELVKQIRSRLGLTQEKLAAKLGVAFPTVNRWENGRVRPSPLALRTLRDVLVDMGDRGTDLLARFFAEDDPLDE